MGIVTAGSVISPAANTLSGEGWRQAGELGLALLLSAAVGLEREIRQKDAGLRTHTLVGVGAALFMLISKRSVTELAAALSDLEYVDAVLAADANAIDE
jgi:uncharacterized membrane protein YhiD involved in acid resistance